MSKDAILKELAELLLLKQEGNYWDFKREWYIDKADLLHDLICMANNLANRDCYIIIGIDEFNDYSLVDVSSDINRKNTQNIVDFLREKKFAGGIRPTVYVQPITYSNITIDVIVIKNDQNTPYYLSESYQGIFSNNIYTRVMDTNTPKNASADRINVEYLWKKHFRLDASPLERVMFYLQHRGNWEDSKTESSSIIEYYKFAPEFTIEHEADTTRNGYEFYLFSQMDSNPHWYDISIRYHQTVIAFLGGVALDGGRYFTTTPELDGITFENNMHCDVSYCYFIKRTLRYIVHQYYYTHEPDDERISHDRFMECILLFDSEHEKLEFDKFVLLNRDSLNTLAQNQLLPYFPELKGYVKDAFKDDYRNALALKALLNEFRSSKDYPL